jgi:hypothetical protein
VCAPTSEAAMFITSCIKHMKASQCVINITGAGGGGGKNPSKWNLTTISGNKAHEQNPYVRKIRSTLSQATNTHNKITLEMTAKRISPYRKRATGNKRMNYLVLCMRYKQSFCKHNEALSTKLNKKITLHMSALRNVCVCHIVCRT